MSIVDAAFAALAPAQWSATARDEGSDPRAEVRRRIRVGACACPGCPRPAGSRARLCGTCRAAGLAYCPRCETVKACRRHRGYCPACNAELRRQQRGSLTPAEAAARVQAGRALGRARFVARKAEEAVEILRLYHERGWSPEEIARLKGVTPSAIRKRIARYRAESPGS